MEIRRCRDDDWPKIWPIFQEVVSKGDTYPYPPGTTLDQAFHLWMEKPQRTFMAVMDDEVVGTYYIKPNQPGLGSHVCNCGYMVAVKARGRGVATAMCQHSQVLAVELGFLAMQFNLVVATNERAVRLWDHLGFSTIGRLPGAYKSLDGRYHDALVMYKQLVPVNSSGA